MVSFMDITRIFFKSANIPLKECASESEARDASKNMDKGYPVYFFNSDTSGEKLYEEFFTDADDVDVSTYTGMGVIKNAKKPSIEQVSSCIEDIQQLMSTNHYDKSDIVGMMKKYLPDFDHIETGRSLDQKM